MRVLVADDNPIVRLGMQAVLEQVAGVTEVIQAVDGVHALELAREHRPDIVLLDVRMPRRDGLDILPEIAAIAPVLMLTHSDEPETIQAALDRGAHGYLVHGALTIEEITGALHTCLHGGLVLGAQAMQVVVSGNHGQRTDPKLRALLSPREQQVMDAVATGLSNVEIAAQEFLSPKTIKNHLNNIYAKLAVTSRADAVARWLGGAAPAGPAVPTEGPSALGPRTGPQALGARRSPA